MPADDSWLSGAAFTGRIVADTLRRLELGKPIQQAAESNMKLFRLYQVHKRQPSLERRVNPLLLPLRLLLALLRILLLPLRILLAPVILLLRALLRLIRLLVLLINPLFYLYLALMVLNIGANIARIVLLILRLIFLRRLKKRKHEEEETRVITLDADSLPVEHGKQKSKLRASKKSPAQGKASKIARADPAAATDAELEAKLIRSAQDDMIDKLRCLGLLSQLAPSWITEAEMAANLNKEKPALSKLCNFHPQVSLQFNLNQTTPNSPSVGIPMQPELLDVIGV